MKTLSDILNVNYSNVYVKRTKIVDSIKLLKEIYGAQLTSNRVSIPFNDIKVHIRDLTVKLNAVNLLIQTHEQQSFAFGS